MARFEHTRTRLEAHGRLTRTTGQLKAAPLGRIPTFPPELAFSPMHTALQRLSACCTRCKPLHRLRLHRYGRISLLHYVAVYNRRMHHRVDYVSTCAPACSDGFDRDAPTLQPRCAMHAAFESVLKDCTETARCSEGWRRVFTNCILLHGCRSRIKMHLGGMMQLVNGWGGGNGGVWLRFFIRWTDLT